MGLRINHNIASLNAFRNLSKIDFNISKSLQRLSSGQRINSAADDPAGLVISQQFRAQISGLNQAVENTETGVSMIQTAEAALTEVHNLLTSIRELAVHAANEGVNDSTMLAADQQQIDSALESIDRIASTTQFGTKFLLDGSKENMVSITTNASDIQQITQSTLSEGMHTVTVSNVVDANQFLNNVSLGLYNPTSVSGLAGGDHVIQITQASGSAVYEGADIDFSSTVTITAGDDRFVMKLDGGADMVVTVAAGGYTSIGALTAVVDTAVQQALTDAGLATTEIAVSSDDNHLVFTTIDHGSANSLSISDGGLTDVALTKLMLSSGIEIGQDAIVTLVNFVNYFDDVDDTNTGSITLYDSNSNSVNLSVRNITGGEGIVLGNTILTYKPTSFLVQLDSGSRRIFEVNKEGSVESGANSLKLVFGEDVAAGTSVMSAVDNRLSFQIGANSQHHVEIGFASMSSSQLGTVMDKISAINIESLMGARSAIDVVDAAINQVSEERAKLGAFQVNTLESTLNSLRVGSENLTAAESSLRDTNFAFEMAEFTKNQILQQAGTAMLAQANLMPQAVLQLLA